jgi:hypothetical protein
LGISSETNPPDPKLDQLSSGAGAMRDCAEEISARLRMRQEALQRLRDQLAAMHVIAAAPSPSQPIPAGDTAPPALPPFVTAVPKPAPVPQPAAIRQPAAKPPPLLSRVKPIVEATPAVSPAPKPSFTEPAEPPRLRVLSKFVVPSSSSAAPPAADSSALPSTPLPALKPMAEKRVFPSADPVLTRLGSPLSPPLPLGKPVFEKLADAPPPEPPPAVQPIAAPTPDAVDPVLAKFVAPLLPVSPVVAPESPAAEPPPVPHPIADPLPVAVDPVLAKFVAPLPVPETVAPPPVVDPPPPPLPAAYLAAKAPAAGKKEPASHLDAVQEAIAALREMTPALAQPAVPAAAPAETVIPLPVVPELDADKTMILAPIAAETSADKTMILPPVAAETSADKTLILAPALPESAAPGPLFTEPTDAPPTEVIVSKAPRSGLRTAVPVVCLIAVLGALIKFHVPFGAARPKAAPVPAPAQLPPPVAVPALVPAPVIAAAPVTPPPVPVAARPPKAVMSKAARALDLVQRWHMPGDKKSVFKRLGGAEHSGGSSVWSMEKTDMNSYLVVYRAPAGTPVYAFEVDLKSKTVSPTPEAKALLKAMAR